jgi:hypothetical protein
MKQKFWCCVNNNLQPDYYLPSLAHRKSDSIATFLIDHTMTWKDSQEYGWKCIRVEVIIKPIK